MKSYEICLLLAPRASFHRQERASKASELVQQWAAPRKGSETWTCQLLPWKLNSKEADEELSRILDGPRTSGTLKWEPGKVRERCKKRLETAVFGADGEHSHGLSAGFKLRARLLLYSGRCRYSVRPARCPAAPCVATWLGAAEEPEERARPLVHAPIEDVQASGGFEACLAAVGGDSGPGSGPRTPLEALALKASCWICQAGGHTGVAFGSAWPARSRDWSGGSEVGFESR